MQTLLYGSMKVRSIRVCVYFVVVDRRLKGNEKSNMRCRPDTALRFVFRLTSKRPRR